MILGVTGHQELASGDAVREALTTFVASSKPSLGLTSLAVGTDQLFADVCRDRGVPYRVVIPAEDYASSFVHPSDKSAFEVLLAAAREVTVLPYQASTDEAFLAAGRWIAEHSDVILAVWDGQPSHGVGGTADIVAYAKSLGKELHIIPHQRGHLG